MKADKTHSFTSQLSKIQKDLAVLIDPEARLRALKDIEHDLMALRPAPGVRLLRHAQYPPPRGAVFSFGNRRYLYATGTIPELGYYPYGHVPTRSRSATMSATPRSTGCTAPRGSDEFTTGRTRCVPPTRRPAPRLQPRLLQQLKQHAVLAARPTCGAPDACVGARP